MPRLPRPALLASALVAVLSGCAQFPEVEAAMSPEAARADYPALMPIDDVLARAAEDGIAGPDLEASLQERAARLRARAAALRAPVVDAETGARLRSGIED
ncbi:hypothetical protein [Ostreiculturibacter nitratireducens]|uniref:hypothetical protein n=1 Tax=Ostreiculturibacter nitratireducens TaxID=3075226 RepID=UPI0031B5EF0C